MIRKSRQLYYLPVFSTISDQLFVDFRYQGQYLISIWATEMKSTCLLHDEIETFPEIVAYFILPPSRFPWFP